MWEKVLKRNYNRFNTATPSPYLDEVYTKYTTAEEKTHALADVYINSRPESSWQHLVQALYTESELAAAKEAKSFLHQQSGGLQCYQINSVCMCFNFMYVYMCKC